MAQEAWGGIGQPLETLESIPHDKSWLDFLPQGASVISAKGYGASYWSQSGKLDVRLEDGAIHSYFIKLTRGDVGKKMAAGDYESLKALYSVSPEMIPKPLGHGTFESDNDLHFLLREFVEMEEMIPDAFDLCQAVGRLHTNSQKLGPTQLGFQVTTCNGTVPQYTQWTSSWEEFFTKKLQSCFELEEYAHGSSSQITELLPDLFEKVCPRLLRPLETNGNNLQPSLIHGDLWDGNISVSANTGRPYIFDPAALWAHNEYDLHTWRGSRFKVAAFTEEYFRQFLPSPPEEDVDDRNLLYSLIADLHDSILFKHTEQFRCLLIQTLRTLVEKFPNGYEGPAARKGSESVNKDG